MAGCRLSIVREMRRCVLGHVRLCRADDGAWPRLRFRPAVGPSAAVRRTVNHVRLQVAKALLAGSVQLEALGAPVGYRRKLAATELARAPYPLFPAPFCGASSARSSICASLACNTPTALRATYPHANVPTRSGEGALSSSDAGDVQCANGYPARDSWPEIHQPNNLPQERSPSRDAGLVWRG